MRIFFDLDADERRVTTNYHAEEFLTARQALKDCGRNLQQKRDELNKISEEHSEKLSSQHALLERIERAIPPGPRVCSEEEISKAINEASIPAPLSAGNISTLISSEDSLDELRIKTSRWTLRHFPSMQVKGPFHPERCCTHCSGKAPRFADAPLSVQNLILNVAANTLEVPNASPEQIVRRIERWLLANRLDRQCPFSECPTGLLYLMFAHRWLNVEVTRLQLESMVIFRFDGVLAQRNEADYSLPVDFRIVVQNYLKLRLDPRFLNPNWIPADIVPDVSYLAVLIEASTYSKYPIDSGEFRRSLLHRIPSEMIHNVAQRAGLGIADARRLPLVDLISIARSRSLEAAGLSIEEIMVHYFKQATDSVPKPQVVQCNSPPATTESQFSLAGDIAITAERFLEAQHTSDSVPRRDAPQELLTIQEISDRLKTLNYDCDAKTLNNRYKKKWGSHDGVRGKAFVFDWNRIRPIVEGQFCVSFPPE